MPFILSSSNSFFDLLFNLLFYSISLVSSLTLYDETCRILVYIRHILMTISAKTSV